MTERNKLLRDALRRVETVAQTALAHQSDGDAACHKHLYDAVFKAREALNEAISRDIAAR